MALTTLANVKEYLGITSTDYDTLLANLILRAQAQIESYCQRTFDSADYRVIYNGDNSSELCLNNYPVTKIGLLSVCRENAFGIQNTSTDAYNATVTVTDTTLELVVQGGTNEDATSLTLASYSDLSALFTAILAIDKGWTVLETSANNIWSPTELLPTGKGLYCLDGYAYLDIPDKPESEFSIDASAGIIKLFGVFPAGHQNIIVRYTAGYSTIPYDLEQICIDLVKLKYEQQNQTANLKSERLGDYAYTKEAAAA